MCSYFDNLLLTSVVIVLPSERKMLALPPPVSVTKEENAPMNDGPLNPPIITHTAATPMATPQGSPNEIAMKDVNNKLSVIKASPQSTLSVDSDRSSVCVVYTVHVYAQYILTGIACVNL